MDIVINPHRRLHCTPSKRLTRKPPCEHSEALLWHVLRSSMSSTLFHKQKYYYYTFIWCSKEKTSRAYLDSCEGKVIWVTPCISAHEKKLLVSIHHNKSQPIQLQQPYDGQISPHPATCASTYHGLHSSTTEKFRDLIQACVPMEGTIMSWSPL